MHLHPKCQPPKSSLLLSTQTYTLRQQDNLTLILTVLDTRKLQTPVRFLCPFLILSPPASFFQLPLKPLSCLHSSTSHTTTTKCHVSRHTRLLIFLFFLLLHLPAVLRFHSLAAPFQTPRFLSLFTMLRRPPDAPLRGKKKVDFKIIDRIDAAILPPRPRQPHHTSWVSRSPRGGTAFFNPRADTWCTPHLNSTATSHHDSLPNLAKSCSTRLPRSMTSLAKPVAPTDGFLPLP